MFYIHNHKLHGTLLQSNESEQTVSQSYSNKEAEEPELDGKLTRTSKLILDYKEFLAARIIQRYWRGYSIRHVFRRRQLAAVVIQKWWRRYATQIFLYKMITDRLQQNVIAHFHRMATKIQALWRGYWIRKTVHDMATLRKIQNSTCEDLLNCIAFHLHHLMRTKELPGIYSVRNSACLARVDRILNSAKYRIFNFRVHAECAQREAFVEHHKRAYMDAKHFTNVPYGGPNFQGFCPPDCDEIIKDYDYEKRIYKIISAYDAANPGDVSTKKIKDSLAEKRHRLSREMLIRKHKKLQQDFCGDVINSMKKWEIIDTKNLTLNHNIFSNPENVETFLTELHSYLDLIAPCACKQENIDERICH